MKRLVLILSLSFATMAAGQPSAADKIAAGRAALSIQDPVTAQVRFQEALALEPANQTAAALLGITRLFNIGSLASSSAFLDQLGFSAGGRNLYTWTATFPQDGNGGPIIPANYNLTDLASFWQNTLVPESVAARANFALVTDPNFVLTLSSSECGPNSPTPVTFDYGDVLMASAWLRTMEFFAHLSLGQNLNFNLDAAMQLAQGDMGSLQRVLSDNPDFLKTGSSSERLAARTALLDLIALYRQASAAIRARAPMLDRAFMLDPGKLADEANFRDALDHVELSVTSPVSPEEHGGKYVTSAPLFTADWSLRAQFPTFSASGFDLTSIPDVSLGGVVAGFTREELARVFTDSPDTLPELGWEWVTPKPQGSTLYRYIALPGGKHLVTGNGGAYLTSNDGTTWTAGRIPGVGQMLDLATNAGKVVAVTNDGAIYASDDSGVTWRKVFRTGSAFHGVTYGGGQYVAVGDNGMVVTSTDGESWDESHPAIPFMNHVIYTTGGRYVAVGSDYANNAVIATSPDSMTWTPRFSFGFGGTVYLSLAQNPGGRLVAVGGNQRAISTDGGNTWSTGTMPASGFSDVAFRSGLFVAVGNGGAIWTSSDGAAWTVATSSETLNFTGVTAGSGATFVVGQGGVILSSTDNVTFTRTITLQPVTVSLALKGLFALKAIDGQLYAGGGDGTAGHAVIIRSSDGQNFTTVSSGTGNNLTDFLKQGSTYYAVGASGTILTSTDSGGTWAAQTTGFSTNINSIAYLNSQFIIVGAGGMIRTSPDGTTWTLRSTGVPGQIFSVAYGNGTYVAVGGNNSNVASSSTTYLLTSPDGATWTVRYNGPGHTFRGIVFYQGVFTAVGTNGDIERSTDGINWQSAGSGDIRTNFTSISVLDGRYYATQANGNLDNSFFESQAAVLVSSDGENWARVPLGTVNQPNRIELFQSRLYTANANASILRTQPLSALAAPTVHLVTASQHVPQGGSVVLMVTTTGEGALVYQWNKNGAPLPGANDVGLALSNLQSGDAASYTLTVSNAAGSVTSDPIVIAVDVSGPVDQTITFGALADQVLAAQTFVGNLDGTSTSSTFETGAATSLPSLGWTALSGSNVQVWDLSVNGLILDIGGGGYNPFSVQYVTSTPLAANSTYVLNFRMGYVSGSGLAGNAQYEFKLGTWNGSTFTPLATTGIAGPVTTTTNFGTNGANSSGIGLSYTTGGSVSSDPIAVRWAQTNTSFGADFFGFDNVMLLRSAPSLTLSATASSALPVTFSVVSGPATVSGNQLTLTGTGLVTVRASQAGNGSFNPAPNVDHSFNVLPSFPWWQQAKFTFDELADPGKTGPNAVYGHDGLSNLVKYALGLEPKTDVFTGLPVVSTTSTDWVYTYTRPSNITDVTYSVEVSTNLTTWTIVLTPTFVTSSGGIDTWHATYPLSNPNVFFRLKVSLPPPPS